MKDFGRLIGRTLVVMIIMTLTPMLVNIAVVYWRAGASGIIAQAGLHFGQIRDFWRMMLESPKVALGDNIAMLRMVVTSFVIAMIYRRK